MLMWARQAPRSAEPVGRDGSGATASRRRATGFVPGLQSDEMIFLLHMHLIVERVMRAAITDDREAHGPPTLPLTPHVCLPPSVHVLPAAMHSVQPFSEDRRFWKVGMGGMLPLRVLPALQRCLQGDGAVASGGWPPAAHDELQGPWLWRFLQWFVHSMRQLSTLQTSLAVVIPPHAPRAALRQGQPQNPNACMALPRRCQASHVGLSTAPDTLRTTPCGTPQWHTSPPRCVDD